MAVPNCLKHYFMRSLFYPSGKQSGLQEREVGVESFRRSYNYREEGRLHMGVLKRKTPKTPYQMTLNFID